MGYDDVEHDGRRDSGMPVGGQHRWVYLEGRWTETKREPDRWAFGFEADKRRADPAPAGSGADDSLRDVISSTSRAA